MNKHALVSVVIPCYRCSDTIERSVESIFKQTLLPYEVILVDDCSGDGTLELLYKLQAQYGNEWIKVISLAANSGPGTARNAGWDLSQQDYIAFLDADDSWHPRKVEVQYGWMIKNPDAMMTGHDSVTKFSCHDNEVINDVELVKYYKVSKFKILVSNRFVTSTVMLKKEMLNRFPAGKKYCEDYFLWTSIIFDEYVCYRLNVPLVFQYKFAYGVSGLSANLWAMEKGELDVYKNLYDRKLINKVQFIFFSFFSLVKYLKRVVV